MTSLKDQLLGYNWSAAHQTEVQVRYNDIDILGHVNNAIYLQYLEQGRLKVFEDFSRARGIELHEMGITVVARIEIDYLHEIKYGQHVIIQTLVEHLGNTSWTMVACIRADDKICALSRVIQVGLDKQMKPQPISAVIRQCAEEYLITPTS